jgi:hypothetical protein
MENIDVKTILMGILASLCGYIFYGYIELSAKVDTQQTIIAQHDSELNDIWSKYNADIEKQFAMFEKFMEFKTDEAKEREQLREELLEFKIEYYKEKGERDDS